MEVTKIPAAKRTELGKRKIGRLRQEGRVPAVVYGMGKQPEHLSVSGSDLERELRRHHRVFHLSVDGQDESVFLQDVQIDALSDEPLHVDFLRIDMQQPMPVEIELTFVGVPAALAAGGVLVRDMSRISINALPAAIPQEIEVKVAALDVGGEILAKDLELPEGATLGVAEDRVVCHIAS